MRPHAGRATPLVEPLTPRETEVLQLLAEGLTNRRIGERLGISEHTAKFHVNAILGQARRAQPRRSHRPGRAPRPAAPVAPARARPARTGSAAPRRAADVRRCRAALAVGDVGPRDDPARRRTREHESRESLSGELAAIVDEAAPSLVRVEGRRRTASSGVVWSADGVIVASHHAVDAEDEVPVGLHDGRTVAARVGRAATPAATSPCCEPRRPASSRRAGPKGDAARPGEIVLA